jgi:hypothetical protein
MRKILHFPFAVAIVFLALSVRAGEVSFSLSPSLVTVGEGVQATFTFSGTRSAPQVDFRLPDGVLRRGTTSGSTFANGVSSASSGTTLVFTREGTFTIGPFDIDFDGEVHHIPATNVVVRPVPQSVAAGGEADAIRLSADADSSASVPGFPFSVTLSLLTSRALPIDENIQLAGGIPEGLTPLAISALGGVERTELDGRIYNVRRYRLTLQADRPGTYSLSPVLLVGIVTGRDRSFGIFGDDPFGFDPFGGSRVRREQVAASPLSVTVSPLPLDRAPEGFSGAVGVFRLSATATPQAVAVGEPVTVTLSLEGVGNIAQVPLPEYGENAAWKAYAPRAVGDTLPPKAVEGRRTHEQVVIPRTTELAELPALSLVVYDVSEGDFRTLTAGPFPLEVSPAADGAESAFVVSADPAAAQAAFPTAQAEDIAYLKEPDGAEGGGWPPAATAAWYAGIPLAALLAAWRIARARRLRGDTAATRRLQAPKAAKAGLRAARKACERQEGAGAVFAALRRAAADWYAHRANLPPGAVGAEKILRALETAGESAENRSAWQEFFALADQALYAPSTIPLDNAQLLAWCDRMATLLRNAERLPLRP